MKIRFGRRAAAAMVLGTLAGHAAAIPPSWQWQWTYGSPVVQETIRCTVQTSDGGYVSAGFVSTAIGGPTDILVIRTDAAGAVVWQRVYDGGGNDEGHSIVETSDGGFVIAGDTTSSAPGFETFVFKIDPLGGVLWGRTYPGNAGGPVPGNSRVIESANKDIVVAGRAADVTVAGNQLPILARLDAGGAPLFSFAYTDARYGATMFGGFSDVTERRVPGMPSHLVPVGFTSPAPGAARQMYVVETFASGVPLVANAYYPVDLDTYANSVTMAPGDNIAVAGRVFLPGGAQQTAFLRTDPAYVPLASRIYRDVLVSFSSLWSLDPSTAMDEFIIGGSVPQTPGAANLDLWLSRLDGAGLPAWAVHYGGPGNDRGHSAGISADGLTISGEEHSFVGVDATGYVVKTDPAGRSGCFETPFDLPSGDLPPLPTPTAAPNIPIPHITWIPQARHTDMPSRLLCSHCPADLNGDGLVDFADYLEFLNLYDAGDLRVDYNGDGLIDFADYLEFLNYYDSCS